VVNELIGLQTPPMPVAWAHLEELRQDVLMYGQPCPVLRGCYNPAPSAAAQARIARVSQASAELSQQDVAAFVVQHKAVLEGGALSSRPGAPLAGGSAPPPQYFGKKLP
jgi:hypothetical protein